MISVHSVKDLSYTKTKDFLDRRKMLDAVLVLQDGRCFLGRSIGKSGKCIGEVCFTTSMIGYQHTITDPSFANQIIVFTFPHIGNIGINNIDNEAKKVFARGVVIRTLSPASHPSSCMIMNDWLEKNNIIGISEVDTRALTWHLRKHGSQYGMICSLDKVDMNNVMQELNKYRCKDDLGEISINSDLQNNINAKYRVAVVDFGAKASIAACLMRLGCMIEWVKPNFAQKIVNMRPDGIVLSNGPGNPEEIAKNFLPAMDIILESKIPVFGICMGHQLLAIALGAKTVKMEHGHRGSNHPVRELSSGRIEITSQNHGFVVELSSLSSNVEVSHVSLFDGSVEGIVVKNYPIFSVQYHPEGGPGTHDSHYLFERFIHNIELYKKNNNAN